MRIIQDITDLNIPHNYQTYISEYLQNLTNITFISRVILFGSCAKEEVKERSDIDIFITATRDLTDEEETRLTYHCRPEYSEKTIPMDVIVQPENKFAKYINAFGMVQKQVNRYGVDLSGLLHKRTGN